MKTKTKIVKAFIELHKAMTIKEISKSIKADYRITHTAVHRLIQENILIPEKIGASLLCRLNETYYGKELILAEEERRQIVFQDKNLRQLQKDILSKIGTSLFVLLLVPGIPGINLLFISNETKFKENLDMVLDTIPLHINAQVITEEKFIEFENTNNKSAHNPIKTLTAKAIQKYVILHNAESFYLIRKRFMLQK
jgi:hypothetical protein